MQRGPVGVADVAVGCGRVADEQQPARLPVELAPQPRAVGVGAPEQLDGAGGVGQDRPASHQLGKVLRQWGFRCRPAEH